MILVIVGRSIQFFLMLMGTRLLTTLLPPQEVGRIALITALTAFFALFLVNPIGMFINRRLHEWAATGRVRPYFRLYWKYLLLVCTGAAVVCSWLNLSGVVTLHIETGWLLLLVCGSLFFNTVNQTVIPSLNLLGYRTSFILLTLATVAAGLVTAAGLAIGLQARAEYWLLGLLIGQAIFGWIGIKVFYDKVGANKVMQQPLSRVAHQRLWIYVWPVALAVGLNWVQMQGYRFILERQVGLVELGLFSAGYGLSASLLGAFELILTTYFQPMLYRRTSLEGAEFHAQAWSDYAGAILPALVFVTALVAFTAPEITAVMLGSAYQKASQYVMLGAIAEAMRVLIGTLGLIAHMRMQTRLLLLPNFVGAMLTIALVIVLVPIVGSGGAAMAIGAGGGLVALSMYWHMRREIAVRLPWRQISHAIGMSVFVLVIIAGLRLLIPNYIGVLFSLLFLAGIGLLAIPMLYSLLRSHLKITGQDIAL